MSDQAMVIIGAGQAGAWAARTLRSEGFSGRIVLLGNEAHPPYERPPLSKEQLQADAPEMEYILSPVALAAQNIEWRPALGCRRIDRARRTLSLSNDETIGYRKIILATGGHARMPQLPGIDAPCVHSLRSLDDARRLRAAMQAGARVLVIGGGWIGLEVAASARKLGSTVTLVEAAASLCARTGSSVLSDYLALLHRTNGVDLRLSAGVLALNEASHAGCRADFADGSSANYDLVVVGIGLVRSDALAREAGLACERGVIVNRQCQTSDPDIYAAGDVTAIIDGDAQLRLESWQNAQDQGIAAARAALGQNVDYRPIPFFWSQQYDALVQLAGLSAPGSRQLLRNDVSNDSTKMISIEVDAEDRVVAAIAANHPRDFRALRKFVADGTRIDVERFADPTLPVAKLALPSA